MVSVLAKFRRGRYLPLLLGLLLFGNGFLHLCYHAHLDGVSGAPAHSLRLAADDAVVSAAEPRHGAMVSAGDFFCPCCSSTVDWWCAPASATPETAPSGIVEPRRDLTPPEFRGVSKLRARAPPLA